MEATISSLKSRVGTQLGVSDWMHIKQDDISTFGAVTYDVEPLHTDADWCRKNSPYTLPIAYGFQTMALMTWMFNSATGDLFMGSWDTKNFPLNYGFNRLRLLTPVRVGSNVRGVFDLKSIEEKRPGEMLLNVDATVELRGADRPALVAEWMMMWVADEGRDTIARVAE